MSAELAARRTAAAAVLADYQRRAAIADVAERATWGGRLADILAFVLAAPGASHVRLDGAAELAAGDLMTALSALADAAVYRSQLGDHEDAIAYQSLAYGLGDDR